MEGTYAENTRFRSQPSSFWNSRPTSSSLSARPEAVALLFTPRAIVPFRRRQRSVPSGVLADLVMRVPCEGLGFVPSAAVRGEVVSNSMA